MIIKLINCQLVDHNKLKPKIQQTGWFLRPDCSPSSEYPGASIAARHRFNQNILPSVMLLQQCHCRNRHRGQTSKSISFVSFVRIESNFFLQYTGDTDAKNDGPEF